MKKIITNITALYFLNILNFLFSFITLPLLVRIYSPGEWGLIVYIFAIMNVLITLNSWGFNTIIVRDISSARENKNKVRRIFSKTFYSQVILSIFIACFLYLYLLFFDIHHSKSYFLASLLIFSNVLFPVWFYYGFEKIKSLSLIQLVPKFLIFICVYFVLNKDSSVNEYILFFSLINFTYYLIWFFYFFLKNRYLFQIISIGEIYLHLKKNFVWFFTNSTNNFIFLFFPLMIGKFIGHDSLGFFNVADRVKSALVSLFLPIIQAVFPNFSLIFTKNKEKSLHHFTLLFKFLMVTLISLNFLIFIFSENIIFVFFGNEYFQSVIILKILSFVVSTIVIYQFLNFNFFVPFNREYVYQNITKIYLLLIVLFSFFMFFFKNLFFYTFVYFLVEFISVSILLIIFYNELKKIKV